MSTEAEATPSAGEATELTPKDGDSEPLEVPRSEAKPIEPAEATTPHAPEPEVVETVALPADEAADQGANVDLARTPGVESESTESASEEAAPVSEPLPPASEEVSVRGGSDEAPRSHSEPTNELLPATAAETAIAETPVAESAVARTQPIVRSALCDVGVDSA